MAAAIPPGSLTPKGGRGVDADPSFVQRASLPGPTGAMRVEDSSASAAPTGPRGTVGPRPPAPPRHTAEGDARPLTAGERSMVRSLFGAAVDPERVKVHNGEYLPFGLQPDDTAMTPNGEIYFNPKRFREDFAMGSAGDKHWLMHEMVHVWQHQLGYPVMLRGAIRIGLSYRYSLEAGQTLGDHNMEAQGDLLADWWAVANGLDPRVMAQPENAGKADAFRAVLATFLANPADKANLP